MMIKDEQVDVKFTLEIFPHGKLIVGSLARPTGMTTNGPKFDIGKLVMIPLQCGLYPDVWFPLDKFRSTIKLKEDLMKQTIIDGDQEKIYLPDWVLLCCYRTAWESLHYQNELSKTKL